MTLKKKIGKLKFEVTLSRLQLVGIIVWVSLLLLLPIAYDQMKMLKEASTSVSETSQVAGLFTSQENFFNYTVDLSDRENLISTLTLLFGILSGIIAFGSLIFILRDRMSKSKVQN